MNNPSSIRTATDTAVIPLSPAQLGVYFDHLQQETSSHYNIGQITTIEGQVDLQRFRVAAEQTIAANATLNMSIQTVDDVPCQIFVDRKCTEVPYIDVRGRADIAEERQRIIDGALWRPFDLEHEPLFRWVLIQTRDNELNWLQVYHHIIVDGWSRALIAQRLSGYYTAHSPAIIRSDPLAEYTEHLRSESEYQQSARHDKDKAYWQKILSCAEIVSRSDTVVTAQPSDPLPAVPFSRQGLLIEGPLFSRLKKVARSLDTTTGNLIAGASALLEAMETGRDDVTLSIPLLGRTGAAARSILSMSSNVVHIRLTDIWSQTQWQVLTLIKHQMRSALRHQRYRIEDVAALIPDIKNVSQLSRIAINQMPFERSWMFAEYTSRTTYLSNGPINHLALIVGNEGETGLHIDLVKNSVSDAPLDLGIYSKRLLHTLDQLCAPGSLTAPLSALCLTPASDLAAISVFNATAHEVETEETGLLPDLLSRTARDHADATALVFEGDELGYAELEARSNALARHLISLGVGPDTVVAIALERSFEMVIALMAVLKAGGAYLPLDPDYPQDRLAYMLEDSKAAVLVTRKEISDTLSLVHNDAPAHVVSLEDTQLQADLDSLATHALTQGDRNRPLKPDNLAYVIYTSGSTGKPKGVGNTHAGVINLVASQADGFNITPGDRVLQFAALSFDVAVSDTLTTLIYGGALFIASSEERVQPEMLEQLIEQNRISHANLPPALVQTMEKEQLAPLTTLVVGGEACPPGLVERFARGRRFINAYGPTETTVTATLTEPLDPAHTGLPPIGSPIWNTEIHVVDGFLRRVPVGVWGEMYISGAGLARGYVGRPDLTAERFVACPFGAPGSRMYRTGDLGRWRADGVLEFGGRGDDQVKLRGFRIEPGEIEAVLVQQPGIAQAAVVLRDVAGEKRLVGYVTAEAETAPDTQTLRRGLEATLPDHMVPSAFMVLDALPLSPSGKLDRRALPDPEFMASPDYTPPDTPDEALLCRLFEELTAAKRVSVTDSFSALGGHSLMAMRLVAAIRKERGVELPLRAVFAQQNPRALACELALASIETLGAVIADSGVGDDGIATLSLGQERLWSLDQLEGGQSAQYNIPVGLRLEGDLDTSALKHALHQIVDHHGVLRTVIEAPDGVPTGRLLALSSFEPVLREIDLRDQPDDALGQLQAFAARPFDLSRDLRLRGLLVRTGEQSWDLALVAHHGVFDGSSARVFFQDLSEGYRAAIGKEDYSPAPLAWSFADWAVWQRDWLNHGGLEKSLSYWEEHLAGAPALLELPTDHDRQENRARHAGYADITLPSDMRVSLEALALDRGTTLFGVLMGAYALMLSRLAGQDEVVVGTPSAGRVLSGSEALIGFFVNTLALRLTPGMSQTLGGYLDTVTNTVREGLEHEAAPFELVVERASVERSLAHTPVFQAALSWQHQEAGGLDLPGVSLSPRVLALPQAKHDLSLILVVGKDREISGAIEYDADLFMSETVERWTTILLNTLDQFCAPGSLTAPLSALCLTPASDLAAI